MKIPRRFTKDGTDVFETVEWATRTSRITHPDGSVVFEMNDAEVPSQWSQLATDIMVSKYFRKAGVPQYDASGEVQRRVDGSVVTGPERSARQVIDRLCGCWKHWGERHGYFDTPNDAQAFYDELAWMLLQQAAAPNSPQWFNTGLNYAYGISGPAQGHYVPDPKTGEVRLADDAYTHPQPHACFIQSVSDDLVNEGGIMDLWVREARLFKYGSGTGTNFSQLRGEGEPLSGGGSSSGLMSWLKIGDRAAAAIKSGGTTRRAAKMVCLDLDHPDISHFINWKVREEIKVAALVEGLKHLPDREQELAKELGLELNYDFNGEAYYTVSGQNSNNSVRIPDAFFDVLDRNGDWELTRRTDGEVCRTIKATDLWNQICYAAWRCADPGVQFDSTINSWHTSPAGGRINASNPCSEYLFLDNTACNLASINLLKFYDPETRTFDVEGYEHAIRLWTTVLEISVLMAAYPSEEIARLSYHYRTLGLGFANLGAMLMQAGIPYDSDEGRALCGTLSAILTGRSYAVSAEMAREHGPFAGFDENRESMLRVIRNHRRAAHGVPRDAESGYEKLKVKPVPIDADAVAMASERFCNANALHRRAMHAWNEALDYGERYGYRNAQVSVIAPTGTIGLLMDCDTTGVEPDFALVKFKKLAGGGYFKIANRSLKHALASLGYTDDQVGDMLRYVMGTLDLDVNVPGTDQTLTEFLIAKGFTTDDLKVIEDILPSVFELHFAFSAWSLRPELLSDLGIDIAAARANPAFNLLAEIGLNREQLQSLNETICGTQTIEGAPHIKDEHLPVFDCANPCGKIGERFIAPEGHIRMMAACQPFISGAISKTINLPHHADVEDIAACYRLSWELGLKANALYRDGCKLSQPLSTKSDVDLDDAEQDDDGIEAAKSEVAAEVIEVAETVAAAKPVEKIIERIVERPLRRRLSDTRQSITHKFNVAGHEGYLTVGMYDDHMPGELFITMSKEGSTIGGLMDSLGTAISVALQYGVPLESLVGKFSHQRFEPAGVTTNRDIPFAKSLVDYIFRWLGMQFIDGYREANAPQRSTSSKDSAAKKDKEKTAPAPAPKAGEASSASASTSAPAPVAGIAKSVNHGNGNGSGNGNGNGNGNGHSRSSGVTGTAPGPKASSATTETRTEGSPASASASAAAPTPVRVAPPQPQVEAVPQTEDDEIEADVDAMLNRLTDNALDKAMLDLMGDAPACDVCGAITVRNGTCYKCLNCGNSMGCS